MPTEPALSFSTNTLFGFLLVLTRVAGGFLFVSMPGIRTAQPVVRLVLSMAITVALLPAWPQVSLPDRDFGRLCGWILVEAGLGIGIGLTVALFMEGFVLAAQVLGMQAGYSYASTIDPSTEADSGVLLIVAQLSAWLLFLSLGLERSIIRTLALSLSAYPPGSFALSITQADGILRLGAALFTTALRIALPIVALLLLVDIAFALLGRINSQLQLLTLTFPVKMLAALCLFAIVLGAFPKLFLAGAEQSLHVISTFLEQTRVLGG